MSIILSNRVRNHIESIVKEHLYLDDINGDEGKLLSRGIAAICLAGLAGMQYAQVAKYIVDGTRDNGIDGVIFDSPRNKLYIVQSKWSTKGTSTIETGEVRKFISGVYDLLNEDWKKFNSRVKSISQEISDAIRNDPEIILVAAYNSDNALSADAQAIVDEFLEDNNSDSQEVVSFRSFDLKRILRTIKAVKSGTKSDVDVNLLQWGEQKEPYYAIYGKISCADVAEWYATHEDLLFSENIRNTLPESDINIQIESALLRQPADFWYLNNGITAIADEVIRKPIGLGDQKESAFWKVGNLKIVNGAQTTGSIAKAYAKNPKSVKKAYVQIKVISLDQAPIDIANRITTATNTQNRVEAKDFLAIDPIQDGIGESMKKIGIQYCYRRGERVADVNHGLEVQELATALAVSSDNMTSVTVAKRNVGSLTDPSGYYSKLFDKNIEANAAWELVKRWRIASSIVATYAAQHSGREAQLAVHGNRFIENVLLTTKGSINSKKMEKIHLSLKAAIDKLYGADCYLAVLFKNTKKCEALRSTITTSM
ncbi:AIPR family protein [Cupriavidus pinatubonensis]|uniref:AIPR family protein n=1 Tax=Cupriavidus pinatubonensis TaxID=248026 RepID=UPI001C7395DC|nr:AIPR family protein [Cupriavidus pinatubonensis]QYY30337.1 AIPR family protein [Cupriavidus pinatubonensis]